MGNPPDTMQRDERFLALWQRNRGRIDRLVRLYSRSPADVEDLRSETALQLWRSLDTFGGKAAEDTWVYRVTLNTALRSCRGRRTRERYTRPLEEPEALLAPGPDPAARLETAERRGRLLAALHRLPEIDRALLALYFDELPYRQIAEITGLSVNHVGVRLHRARRMLAALMKPERPPAEVTDDAPR